MESQILDIVCAVAIAAKVTPDQLIESLKNRQATKEFKAGMVKGLAEVLFKSMTEDSNESKSETA